MPDGAFRLAKPRIEEDLTYDVFDADIGWVAIVASDHGVVRPRHSLGAYGMLAGRYHLAKPEVMAG